MFGFESDRLPEGILVELHHPHRQESHLASLSLGGFPAEYLPDPVNHFTEIDDVQQEVALSTGGFLHDLRNPVRTRLVLGETQQGAGIQHIAPNALHRV